MSSSTTPEKVLLGTFDNVDEMMGEYEVEQQGRRRYRRMTSTKLDYLAGRYKKQMRKLDEQISK